MIIQKNKWFFLFLTCFYLVFVKFDSSVYIIIQFQLHLRWLPLMLRFQKYIVSKKFRAVISVIKYICQFSFCHLITKQWYILYCRYTGIILWNWMIPLSCFITVIVVLFISSFPQFYFLFLEITCNLYYFCFKTFF